MTRAVLATGIIVLMLLSLFVSNGFSQDSRQQTTFGSEMEIEKPIKVPSSFFRQMTKADRRKLNECQHQTEYPALQKKNWHDHFVGSVLDVRNAKGSLDILVVQADSGCFWGAHNTKFWILSKRKSESPKNYKKIFEGQMDGLEVANRASRVYPNLEIMSHTAIEMFTTTYRYRSGRYRAGACYVENMGDDSPNRPRVKCGKYDLEFRK